MLLTIVTMLYIKSQNSFMLYSWIFVPFWPTSLYFSLYSPLPGLWKPSFYSLLSITLTTLDFAYNWDHAAVFFLWLISLCIMSSGPCLFVCWAINTEPASCWRQASGRGYGLFFQEQRDPSSSHAPFLSSPEPALEVLWADGILLLIIPLLLFWAVVSSSLFWLSIWFPFFKYC